MDDDETLTAYHEAGHAAVGYALGGTVEALQLDGENEVTGARYFGECRISWRTLNGEINTQYQREILTVLAGPAAELVYRGELITLEHLEPWKQDLNVAWGLLHRIGVNSRDRLELMGRIIDRLKEVINEEPCWPAVASLADALLAREYLEEDEVEEILAFWMQR
ncbi:MAG: hypothetical protein VXZ38_08820 [Planctomycetota bacterium]|nr:hypothetical protein [Planctomycetota bacterium]